MKTLGLCIGATTLSAVAVHQADGGSRALTLVQSRPHDGNPRQAVADLLASLPPGAAARIAVTGRRLRHALRLSAIAEPQAVETALAHLGRSGPTPDTVVSVGGESLLVYRIGPDGRIRSVHTGGKCAAGTGEFFIQQVRRLGLDLETGIEAARGETPYQVVGRCSVFCKSDCTHAANQGVPRGRIAAGLCAMMANKVLELLAPLPHRRVMLIGGAAQNGALVESLRAGVDELLVPPEAPWFEAYGAALWALDHETLPLPPPGGLMGPAGASFRRLPPLAAALAAVEFRTLEPGLAQAGDRCILGLDVGSTTSKAVLLRQADRRVLASVYRRTAGDPVGAARACYAELAERLGPLAERLAIVGLGVTGSGRQIAGLHAGTRGVINEIIAHATGARFFDPGVETIFEIGGQDAKYTQIEHGVPVDYAMNDACSAGTGSFLEEAAGESLGVALKDIAPLALAGTAPPNFSDQCAAFIGSDVKNAAQEGIGQADLLAGLVYSVCMNYCNRVKGNRPIGATLFMQGGVCYNRAVPAAMAALTGRRILVPPEPGLIGAFGVALEVAGRLERGLMAPAAFALKALAGRGLEAGRPFTCTGGAEGCDRRCSIARVRVDGRTIPFGGACNRWLNLHQAVRSPTADLDLVGPLQWPAAPAPNAPERAALAPADGRPTLGLNRSFLMHAYWPFFTTFFSRLGFRPVVPQRPDPRGLAARRAAFCYPAELAHGLFHDLLERRPDYLVLPHLRGAGGEQGTTGGVVCPTAQGEPYFLAAAFQDHPWFADLQHRGRILRPVLDLARGFAAARADLLDLGAALGRPAAAADAFRAAVQAQEESALKARRLAEHLLEGLRDDPTRIAIVLFGRPYNAWAPEADKGIARKFASRGLAVIPHSALPLGDDPLPQSMYWSSGRQILKAAALVARHPRLFGCYITNFSCGPDSFLLGDFRRIMGGKPALVLELDAHVADAGLTTRIEAFLDILSHHRAARVPGTPAGRETRDPQPVAGPVPARPVPARLDQDTLRVHDSAGRALGLTDPRVHLILPSMGHLHAAAMAAVFRSAGVRASALPDADPEALALGRAASSGKECLPLQLTVGSLLKYLEDRPDTDELLVYFMPASGGPCRFGQYSHFLADLIERRALPDLALWSPSADDSYAALDAGRFTLKLWTALTIADRMADLYGILLAGARAPAAAAALYREECAGLLRAIAADPRLRALTPVLKASAARLAAVPLARPPREVPTILLTGEIFVRHDALSRQGLVERLAAQGFAVRVAGLTEWVQYTDLCVEQGWKGRRPSLPERAGLLIRGTWKRRYDRAVTRLLAASGLLPWRARPVADLVAGARVHLSPLLLGESVLTVGAALTEVPEPHCGVIAIGPFGCMPNRVAEAVLTPAMDRGRSPLPFLAIETDGTPFPQLIEARLEVFLMQAARVHARRQTGHQHRRPAP